MTPATVLEYDPATGEEIWSGPVGDAASEVAAAREAWPDGFFVVPGVRPEGSEIGDQKRVVTPRQAVEQGASILVIGRPITGAANPAQVLSEMNLSLNDATGRTLS